MGFEQDGKYEKFARPVLVIRNDYSFAGLLCMLGNATILLVTGVNTRRKVSFGNGTR